MKTTTIILIVIGAVIISSISTALILKQLIHKKHHLHHFSKIEEKLELSEEQSTKVKNLVLEYMPRALEVVLYEDDKEVIRTQIHELHNEAKKKMQELLTPQQFEELTKLKKKCPKKRFHKRHCFK